MRTKRGSIIAFSIILLSILLTSGLSVVAVAALEKQSSLSTQKSVVAFQAADSGIERVLKRIYIDNSPALTSVPLDDPMPTDLTLQQVAQGLQGVTSASCNVGTNKVVATSSNDPAYTFEISFFDGSDTQISCADTAWRDKVVRLKTEGFFRQTSRVIELGVEPRPRCDASDTVTDNDGNTYGIVIIGDQCWMDSNMRVGTQVSAGSQQGNDGTIQKYCYNNNSANCLSGANPDGGLYVWNEAMQYSISEGAQGICPNGWHIPTDDDWYYLENFLDSAINNPNSTGWRGIDGGTKLKVGGTSGFEAKMTGYWDAVFSSQSMTRLWSSSDRGNGSIWSRGLDSSSAQVDRSSFSPLMAFPVRCVVDEL